MSATVPGQGERRSQALRGAEHGTAASATSLASRPASRAPTAALPGFSRDARVLALLERIAAGVEGLRDELRGVAALATLAQDARGAEETASLASGSTAASNAPACELLTAKDVCALLKLDARTLRVLRHEGCVPEPIKLGRSLRWRRAEIEAWIAEQGGDADARAGEHP